MEELILEAKTKENTQNTEDNAQNVKENTKEKEYQPQMHGRDVNSHLIFSNPVLTCQFLKGYTGIELFQDLAPEDIEDVTERYQAFLGVEFEEKMKEYLPDFQYKVVRLHDYTNDELQEKNDEMSLVMMINKVQSEQDYQEFLNITKKIIVTIYQNASAEIQEIYRDIMWTLLMQMKVPQEQAQEMIKGLGVKGMGYLFENLKGIDIGKMQEESRELKKSIETMKEELIDAQSQLTDAQSQLTDTQNELTETRNKMNHLLEKNAKRMYDQGITKEAAMQQLMELFELGEAGVMELIRRYWK